MLPLPWRRLLVPKLRGGQVGLTVSPPEQAMELVEHSHRVYLQQGLWSDGNFQRSRRSCFKSNFQAFFFKAPQSAKRPLRPSRVWLGLAAARAQPRLLLLGADAPFH